MSCYLAPELAQSFQNRFEKLYGAAQASQCMRRLQMLLGRYGVEPVKRRQHADWDEGDSILITYGDMVRQEASSHLQTLREFMNRELEGVISGVHILPFFPYSSDEGFSVKNYREVRDELGDWGDIELISATYRLMADLVVNHASRESDWFRDYKKRIAPENDYFLEAEPSEDLSEVVRPRSSSLLTEVETADGPRHVWTTFSADQVDLNFSNPDVLFEFLDILLFYVSRGIEVIRLDAIAYLWKKIGTSCIHLPETHQVVRLMRDLLDLVAPHVTLITETNVPHEENVSYFGGGDEAHMVYQFSLPPLLLHAIRTGNAQYLTDWAVKLEKPPEGCYFFNFTSSHDGIGVRPLEGLVPDEELHQLADGTKKRGGYVSFKKNSDGSESPYELNITYYDAFADPGEQDSPGQVRRFLCSQALMLSLQGIPGIYFHCLTATPNDREKAEASGVKRDINRSKWNYEELQSELNQDESVRARVFGEYKRLLRIREQHPAFHPAGAQQVFRTDPRLFAIERTSPAGSEKILVIGNVSGEAVELGATEASPLDADTAYRDLIGESERRGDDFVAEPWQVLWLLRC